MASSESTFCPTTGQICPLLESLEEVSQGITELDCSSRRGINYLREVVAESVELSSCAGATKVEDSDELACGSEDLIRIEGIIHDQAGFIGIMPRVLVQDFSYTINK